VCGVVFESGDAALLLCCSVLLFDIGEIIIGKIIFG
jgi:hypothetical protein